MRTPEEILKLVLNIANEDDNIRAVLMTGSRANPDCPVDIYQDFDIVYFVKDIKPYWDNDAWIEDKFCKPAFMQKPESMSLIPPDNNGNYAYLMMFPDGNRIDLQITKELYVDDGEPAILLLDKDGTFPKINVAKDYWYIEKPNQKFFSDCCNEFHWCLNNVAKGIAREELSYAMEQFQNVRDMLMKMLEWHIGVNNNFAVSAGKSGKYFKKFLSEDVYLRFTKTYSDTDYEHMWEAAFEMLYLFDDVAKVVADKLEFAFNVSEAQGIESYMKRVRNKELQSVIS